MSYGDKRMANGLNIPTVWRRYEGWWSHGTKCVPNLFTWLPPPTKVFIAKGWKRACLHSEDLLQATPASGAASSSCRQDADMLTWLACGRSLLVSCMGLLCIVAMGPGYCRFTNWLGVEWTHERGWMGVAFAGLGGGEVDGRCIITFSHQSSCVKA